MSDKIALDLFEQSKQPLDISNLPIRTYLDIPYTSDENSPAQRLDIALPLDKDGLYPVVVFIHGGGWYYGDKRNIHTYAAWNTIPQAGFALVSINYRLTQKAAWPAQMLDIKAAIRYIREHAPEYALDADKIGVWGNSAGGQLAAMLAATGGDPDYEDIRMGSSGYSSSVQAACIWYGIFDFSGISDHWKRILKPEDIRAQEDYDAVAALFSGSVFSRAAVQASAVTHIHAQMPPMLLFHGTADNVVPYLQSVEFFEKYIRYNDHSKIHMELFENAPHGGPDFINKRNLDMVTSFFDRWLHV